MIISPQVGLHENVVSLDYDSEYANLIMNHNLSYETVTSQDGGVVVHTTIQLQQERLTANSSREICQKTALFQETIKRISKRKHGVSLVRTTC